MPGIPIEPAAEWSVLLAACSILPSDQKLLRLRSALTSFVQWEHLFALAEQHGVQPLLYEALQQVRDAMPAEQVGELERSHQTNLQKVLLLSRELIRIVHRLHESDLDVMPYKGPALAEFLYGDIALRQAGDIDLLVRPEELTRVRSALAKLGYTPQTRFSEAEERVYLKSGSECVFDGPAGRNVLEVQWAIEPRFYSVDFDMRGIFDRAVAVTVAGQPMKALSPGDLFLILAVHAAKHVWARLIWICDLARLMNQPSLDWDWVARQARSLGILRIVKISIAFANRMLGAEVPAEARDWLREEQVETNLAVAIQQQIFRECNVNVESLSYFRLMMRLRERRLDRMRLVARLALTPGPGEWKAIRLPAELFPLYRIVRLSRLLVRALGA
jgi:hypothetical protein